MKTVFIYSSECTTCGSIQNHMAALRGKIGEANYKIIDTNRSHYFSGSDLKYVEADILEHIRIMEILELPMDRLVAVVDVLNDDGTHSYSPLRAW